MLCAYLYVPPIRAGMRDRCINSGVEFTVSKMLLYEILIMLGIKFITNSQLFTRL